ncbi:hypothetical protein [Rhodococcus sp. YH3-3]|nr:hypothetical protein [Rhodococcus sp. YH3-3]
MIFSNVMVMGKPVTRASCDGVCEGMVACAEWGENAALTTAARG